MVAISLLRSQNIHALDHPARSVECSRRAQPRRENTCNTGELRIIQQPRRSELNQSSFLGAPRVGDLDARKPMRGLESHFDGPGPVAFWFSSELLKKGGFELGPG
jgi:hypothetical protein